jgi:hypothetical protein
MIPCLEGALERREPWGVWGGQLLVDGRVLMTNPVFVHVVLPCIRGRVLAPWGITVMVGLFFAHMAKAVVSASSMVAAGIRPARRASSALSGRVSMMVGLWRQYSRVIRAHQPAMV